MFLAFMTLLAVPGFQDPVPEIRIATNGDLFAGGQRISPDHDRPRYLFRNRPEEAELGVATPWRELGIFLEPYAPQEPSLWNPREVGRFQLLAPPGIRVELLADLFLHFPRCGFEEVLLVSDCLPEPLLLSPISYACYSDPLRLEVAPDADGDLRFSFSKRGFHRAPQPGRDRFEADDLATFLAGGPLDVVTYFQVPASLTLQDLAGPLACLGEFGVGLSAHWKIANRSYSRGAVVPAIHGWNTWLSQSFFRDRWPGAMWEDLQSVEEALACFALARAYPQDLHLPPDSKPSEPQDRIALLIQTVAWVECGFGSPGSFPDPDSLRGRFRHAIDRILQGEERGGGWSDEELAWELILLGHGDSGLDDRHGEAWQVLRRRVEALPPESPYRLELELIGYLLDPAVHEIKAWKDLPDYERMRTLAYALPDRVFPVGGEDGDGELDWFQVFLTSFALAEWGGASRKEWQARFHAVFKEWFHSSSPGGRVPEPDANFAEIHTPTEVALATLAAIYAVILQR